MVGQTPKVGAPSSQWSPAIARQQARQAEAAAKLAAKNMSRIQAAEWRRQTTEASKAAKEQSSIRMREWNRQQSEYKKSANALLQSQKSADARALAQSKAQAAKMAKLGGASPLGFAKNIGTSQLVNAGKNINWVGRQLTYNFTLPLAVAGTALFKFAMDNERAMTQLTKLYGNVGDDTATLKAETDALGKSFELMSNRFGIVQADVINVGAAW